MSDKEDKQVSQAFQKANETTKDFTLYNFNDIKSFDAVDKDKTDNISPMKITYQDNRVETFQFAPEEFEKIVGFRSTQDFSKDVGKNKQVFDPQGAIVRDLEGFVYIGKNSEYVKLTEQQYQELSGGRSDAKVLDSLNAFNKNADFLKSVKGVQVETYLLKDLKAQKPTETKITSPNKPKSKFNEYQNNLYSESQKFPEKHQQQEIGAADSFQSATNKITGNERISVGLENGQSFQIVVTQDQLKDIQSGRKDWGNDALAEKLFSSEGDLVQDQETGDVYFGKDGEYVKMSFDDYKKLRGDKQTDRELYTTFKQSLKDSEGDLNKQISKTYFILNYDQQKSSEKNKKQEDIIAEKNKKQEDNKLTNDIKKDIKDNLKSETEEVDKEVLKKEEDKKNKPLQEEIKKDTKEDQKEIQKDNKNNTEQDREKLEIKKQLSDWKKKQEEEPIKEKPLIKPKELSETQQNTKKDIEAYSQFSFVAKRNSAIQLMIDRGPDFMNNAFDVIILCTPKIEHEKRIQGYGGQPMVDFFDEFHKVNEVFGDDLSAFNTLGDSMGFATRINNISIPQPVSETFDLPFLFTKIKKVKSKVNFTKKQMIEAFLDEPMFFATIFDLVSNNNRMTLEYGKNPTHWAPFSTTLKSRDGIYNKSIRIDIYVKQLVLLHDSFRDKILSFEDTEENVYGGVNTQKQQLGLKPEATPYWCFEDVNFMGQAKQLTFDHTSQSPLTGEFPFIFKRLYKVDLQKRDAEINKKRISESIFQPYKPTLDLYPNLSLNR